MRCFCLCRAKPTASHVVAALQILLQVKGGLQGGAIGAAASQGNLLKAFLAIGKEEGIMGYWKGNLPQVGATPALLGPTSPKVAGTAGENTSAGPCHAC